MAIVPPITPPRLPLRLPSMMPPPDGSPEYDYQLVFLYHYAFYQYNGVTGIYEIHIYGERWHNELKVGDWVGQINTKDVFLKIASIDASNLEDVVLYMEQQAAYPEDGACDVYLRVERQNGGQQPASVKIAEDHNCVWAMPNEIYVDDTRIMELVNIGDYVSYSPDGPWFLVENTHVNVPSRIFLEVEHKQNAASLPLYKRVG